ncbi:hypothetical protein ACQEU8_22755 [Streptomyces sp. CA-250714]|uniref:hypothetical protein n=1 Tax=Streptomyces sp. CA-250714 TaxID=3240060 RepID=UPI003D8AC024
MLNSRPLPVPVREDAVRWSTFHHTRTVVVAARTLVSTIRVLECLPQLLRNDSRIAVVFAYDPTSAFSDGVLDLLHDTGCRVVPWEQLDSLAPDLLISASENIDVPKGDYPVLYLPHGVGFQKFVPDSRSSRTRLSGAVQDELLDAQRAWLAISHPSQRDQLHASNPQAAERTVLVGDPCFDELRAGLGRASWFRQAMGVGDGQHLVVVSSTWGPTSLLGRRPDLLARLLAELPYDQYRVAAILHPNVWSSHGTWHIRMLLDAALEAGLMLIPPVHAWRSVLVAASVLVGDHGSVTLYGAALGKPVLLGAFGTDAVPGTAIAALGRQAPKLREGSGLHRDVEEVLATHVPQKYAGLADRAFAEPGNALAKLRTVIYRLMELPEPTAAPVRLPAPPAPEPPSAHVTSFMVTTRIDRHADRPTVSLRRYPACVSEAMDETADSFSHLCCAQDERDTRLTESASVLVHHSPAPTADAAERWIGETLSSFPGSLLAATAVRAGGCLVGVRDGRVVEATATDPDADTGLLAAVVYTCLRAQFPVDGTLVRLKTSPARQTDVTLRQRPSYEEEPT